VTARDDTAARLIHYVNGLAEVAFGGQPLDLRSAAGRGLLERHELETIFAVPASQTMDCFAADTAIVVVDDRQRASDGSGVFVDGRLARKGLGGHGAEWYRDHGGRVCRSDRVGAAALLGGAGGRALGGLWLEGRCILAA